MVAVAFEREKVPVPAALAGTAPRAARRTIIAGSIIRGSIDLLSVTRYLVFLSPFRLIRKGAG
jgi:hypothetical protein